MFETLFARSGIVECYRAAPLPDERLGYLEHCARGGTNRRTLRNHAELIPEYVRATASLTPPPPPKRKRGSPKKRTPSTLAWACHHTPKMGILASAHLGKFTSTLTNLRDHLLEAIMAARGGRPTEGRTAELEDHHDFLTDDGIEHHKALPALHSKRKGRPKRRQGRNLAIRLRDHRSETLRFLCNPAVPATNNMAKQDLRPLKVKQRISGSFRTEVGAKAFAVLRSLVGPDAPRHRTDRTADRKFARPSVELPV